MSDEVPLTRREAREAEEAQKRAKGTASEPATEVFGAAAQDGQTQVFRAAPSGGNSGAGHLGGAGPTPPGIPPRGGFAALIARHPNAWMYSALGVIFLLLGTASVFTGVAVGSAAPITATESAEPSVAPTREAPADAAAATALRTCSIASLAADARLLTFEGSVINITTGEVLYDHAGTTAAPPASVLKVITSAAALMTVGPNFQIPTRVFEGSEPGSIVLVGYGDPTLSRLPQGTESVYKGAPKLADLAAQVKTRWAVSHPGEEITKLILDSNYWSPTDKWDSTWDRVEQRDGWQSQTTALMVDGDRDDPTSVQSRRSDDAIAQAGVAFKNTLALDNPLEIVSGAVPSGSPILLGEVKSQPMSTLIAQMLDFSDNSLGENIARIVSKENGGGGSSASLASVIPSAIANLGLDTQTITIRDGSGLSASNLVPPLFMSQLMAKVATGEQELGVIKSAMPIAGKTGSLRSRFNGTSEIARGQVFAKTGWINSSRTLSGWLSAKDGSLLSFAFYALGPVKENATAALDAVTTGAFTCGNNLSNN